MLMSIDFEFFIDLIYQLRTKNSIILALREYYASNGLKKEAKKSNRYYQINLFLLPNQQKVRLP